MLRLCTKVLGVFLIFCVITFSNERLSAETNATFSETIASISQTVNKAKYLERKSQLEGINRRYITNQLQAVVVSGLETYPSQARVIIQSAIQVPYKVRKRVIESVRRDFPGFVYLLKPVSGREVTAQREKLLLTGNNEKYASSGKQSTSYQEKFSLTELVLGASAHDVGAFGRNKESGENFNIELRFTPFNWSVWRMIYEPQPLIGIHLNSDNNTNQIYAGAGWVFNLRPDIFVFGTLGLSVHDGKTSTTLLNRKELGSGLLFRESLEVGYRLTKMHAISVYLDHISNAGIAENNEGLDTFGLRYSYRL